MKRKKEGQKSNSGTVALSTGPKTFPPYKPGMRIFFRDQAQRINLFKSENYWAGYLTQTLAIQDFESYGKRDMEPPKTQ